MIPGENFVYKARRDIKVLQWNLWTMLAFQVLYCLSDLGKCLGYESYYPSSHRIHTQTPVQLVPVAASQASHPSGGVAIREQMALMWVWLFPFCFSVSGILWSCSRSCNFKCRSGFGAGGSNGDRPWGDRNLVMAFVPFSAQIVFHPGLGYCCSKPNLDLLS